MKIYKKIWNLNYLNLKTDKKSFSLKKTIKIVKIYHLSITFINGIISKI